MNGSSLAITVDSLHKNFGDFTAVKGLSFDIRRNEIFGLLGPNGAGKTTTINMICGLLSPTSGTIKFYDAIHGKTKKSLIGYCSQENIFYPRLTCLEQLLFIGRMYGLPSHELSIRAKQLLELLGLADKSNVFASKLSGGMKRRLNLCLALIHEPEILILDEPEAGLDPQSRILVRDFIKSFAREKTIILTTHNMDEADRLADRVAIIDYGKLLLLDTPDKMKKTIGEGDILELTTDCSDNNLIISFISLLKAKDYQVKVNEKTFFIRHKDIINYIGEVKDIAEEGNLNFTEIKLRANTLEDVFIHLTGRSLRQ